MKSKAYLLLVTFWMYSAVRLVAQTDEFVSKHYTMRDGLLDDGINSIMQDSEGFLWISTNSGLSRFDGYSFKTYRNNPASSNSLGNNIVGKVWEDRQGRLWISHFEGIDVFDPRTEKFILFFDSLNWISNLHERRDGKLWLCTSNGTYLANPENFYTERLNLPDFWFSYRDTIDTDGSVWVANPMELVHLDKKNASILQYLPNYKTPFGLLLDKKNRLWIATMSGLDLFGLNLFNSKDKSFTHYLPNVRVSALLENYNGELWVGSESGLYVLDPEQGKYVKLTDESITSMVKDKQGFIWLGTRNGLQQLSPSSKKFSIYRQFRERIGFITEGKKDNLWMLVGEPGGTMNLINFDSDLKKIYKYPYNPSTQPKSIFADNKGFVWLASVGKLDQFHPDKKIFSSLVIPIDPSYARPSDEPIRSFIDSYGTIWLGGWHNLNKYDPDRETYQRITSFPGSSVSAFLEDWNKNLWIGSSAGLIRYSLESGKLDVFKNDPGDPQSLSNNTVFNLIMDKDEIIWIGTAGGLNMMIKGKENDVPKFMNWRTAQSGLPNDDVYGIVDGGDETLWLTCGNMISHFNPKNNSFRNYDQNEGLSGKIFRGGNGIRSHDGRILFSSIDGLVVFHPDSLEDNAFVPPVKITGFSIRNQPVPVKGTDADTLEWPSPLETLISHNKELKLTHQENDLTFEFAALNFANPEKNQYKYKLEPYETEWIATPASNRIARYTNISPGTYTFRVIGSNEDGIWNEEGATLLITITPPWWQTWWAYILYGFAFIGVILSWRSYDLKRAKLKHFAAQLSELDNLKTRFFANISHEFRTPISLILGPLKEMYNGTFKGDQKPAMGVMMRNGQRLLRLINQLLDLSKIEAGKMQLYTTLTDLVQLLREIASSYESLAVDKKIKYFLHPEVQELIIYVDHEKIEKVVHNILSNAFKFSKAGGEVILNLKTEEKFAVIAVRDTGIGIPDNQLDKVFDRFYQVDSSQTRGYEGSGLGMALAKELVELHHGRISVESKEGKGTTFTVLLPLGKEHLRKEEINDSEDIKKIKIFSEDQVLPVAIVETETVKTTVTSDHPVVLIVEDNTDMRNYIRKTLSEYYLIHEAANGKEGLKKADEMVPDLIISDIMMPEMDGYKLCEIIKSNELTSHIPVILLTAKADRESKLTGLETGADDYLSKPFDADELKLIVRNRIEERRKMRERFSREVTLEPMQITISSLDEKFLQKVLTLIETHMEDEDFSIEDFSQDAGYSRTQFYRKIKALSGQTPSVFMRTIRLKRAAELLTRKSDNVSQIAYSVGFSNLSYFNKCFKEQFGVTPGQFSEKYHSNL